MEVDRETLELAQRIRERGDEYPTLPDSIVYRLAAANLLDAPAPEVRGLQDAFLDTLDPAYLLQRAILKLQEQQGEVSVRPGSKEIMELLAEVMRLLEKE